MAGKSHCACGSVPLADAAFCWKCGAPAQLVETEADSNGVKLAVDLSVELPLDYQRRLSAESASILQRVLSDKSDSDILHRTSSARSRVPSKVEQENVSSDQIEMPLSRPLTRQSLKLLEDTTNGATGDDSQRMERTETETTTTSTATQRKGIPLLQRRGSMLTVQHAALLVLQARECTQRQIVERDCCAGLYGFEFA